MDWINVKQHQPDGGAYFFVYAPGFAEYDYHIAFYYSKQNKWKTEHHDITKYVTHYLFPNPPKE